MIPSHEGGAGVRTKQRLPVRYCFCPYIGAYETCGHSIRTEHKIHCRRQYRKGREDCPVIQEKGDI